MSDLVTRYVIAFDNNREQRKEKGHERRYLSTTAGAPTLTTNCERAARWNTRSEAEQIAKARPGCIILEWLLPE